VKSKTGVFKLTVRGGENESPYVEDFSEFEVQALKELGKIFAVRTLMALDCGDVA
jgi:hypothetical protein